MNPGTPFEAARHNRFSASSSFAGVPAVTLDDVAGARAVIIGAPFDWGTTNRPGARFGPKMIRETDTLGAYGERPHLPTGLDALEGVVDIGDVVLSTGDIEGDLEMTDFQGRTMTQKDFSFKEYNVRATPVLAFFDLDGKLTIGKGDVILRELSGIFLDNTRGSDIVARYGGEEFLVVLPGQLQTFWIVVPSL